jgi:hypothetical protein
MTEPLRESSYLPWDTFKNPTNNNKTESLWAHYSLGQKVSLIAATILGGILLIFPAFIVFHKLSEHFAVEIKKELSEKAKKLAQKVQVATGQTLPQQPPLHDKDGPRAPLEKKAELAAFSAEPKEKLQNSIFEILKTLRKDKDKAQNISKRLSWFLTLELPQGFPNLPDEKLKSIAKEIIQSFSTKSFGNPTQSFQDSLKEMINGTLSQEVEQTLQFESNPQEARKTAEQNAPFAAFEKALDVFQPKISCQISLDDYKKIEFPGQQGKNTWIDVLKNDFDIRIVRGDGHCYYRSAASGILLMNKNKPENIVNQLKEAKEKAEEILNGSDKKLFVKYLKDHGCSLPDEHIQEQLQEMFQNEKLPLTTKLQKSYDKVMKTLKTIRTQKDVEKALQNDLFMKDLIEFFRISHVPVTLASRVETFFDDRDTFFQQLSEDQSVRDIHTYIDNMTSMEGKPSGHGGESEIIALPYLFSGIHGCTYFSTENKNFEAQKKTLSKDPQSIQLLFQGNGHYNLLIPK